MAGFITQKEKLSFREICLAHLKVILDISTVEFRGGYKKLIVQGNYSFEEYVPSTSKNYIQAIESFRDILLPHFDTKMEKVHENILKRVENLQGDLVQEKEKRIQDAYDLQVKKHKRHPSTQSMPDAIEFEERFNEAVQLGSREEQRLTQRRLRLMSELFRELNLLLKRVDYLKASVYSEGDLDDDDEEEQENDEKSD